MSKLLEKSASIAVIGCGAIAELYHLPALAACRQTGSGIILAEPNPHRLEQLRQKFPVTLCVSNYEELEGRVAGVIVATPPSSHYQISKWFLERGVHVLCEKPLTEDSEQARELVEVAENHHVSLAVNQTRRLFPTYIKIRELIAEGVLGDIQSIVYHDGVEFNWPAASPHHFQPQAKGAWSDVGVHLLDAICYWLDGKPNLTESLNDSFGGPEAMATVRGTYKNAEIEIKVSRLGRLMNGFQICGSLGMIEAEAEDWDEFTVVFHNGTRKRYKCGSNRWQYTDFAKPLIENFAAVVAGKAQPLISGYSTLATIELLEQAYADAQPYAMAWNDHLKQTAKPPQLGSMQLKTQDPMRVLVTGASGFLGGRIVEALQLSQFASPVAAIRQWTRAARIACRPIDIVLCDIMDPLQVHQAVEKVDAIVHCAYGDSRDSIVEGTRTLLNAAAHHNIERFVHLSSAEVYGRQMTGVVTEDCIPQPTGNPYGDSKLEAENLCRSYHDRGLLPTILRPSLIYGPFGSSWSVDVAKRLQSGKWGVFDGFGEGIANLVYVDDLLQAICLSLAKHKALGETYNVNGPDRITWNEYFRIYNSALGLPPLMAISPTKSRMRTFAMDTIGRCTTFAKSRWEDKLMEIYLRGGIAGRWMKRLRNALKSTPSTGELTDLYARQANYDDVKIKQQLGYSPQFDLSTGIAHTIQWLKLHEVVPSIDRSKQVPPADSTFIVKRPALT